MLELDKECLAQADFEITQALEGIAECKKTGVYKGYSSEVVTLSLKPWERI
jgi:hypothetical protein